MIVSNARYAIIFYLNRGRYRLVGGKFIPYRLIFFVGFLIQSIRSIGTSALDFLNGFNVTIYSFLQIEMYDFGIVTLDNNIELQSHPIPGVFILKNDASYPPLFCRVHTRAIITHR